MRRNCNLTLSIVPPHSARHHRQQPPPIDGVDFSGEDWNHRRNENQNQNQNQQLTIFYDGRVSVCDVTDAQAREIIKVASEEMEEKLRSKRAAAAAGSEKSSPSPTGLSMKASLERFLQKRKHRIQANSPYHL